MWVSIHSKEALRYIVTPHSGISYWSMSRKRAKYTYRSVDLFAGCGGIARGFDDAGIECVAFNEINKDAANSYAINFPNAVRFDGDIRTALSPEIIENKGHGKVT